MEENVIKETGGAFASPTRINMGKHTKKDMYGPEKPYVIKIADCKEHTGRKVLMKRELERKSRPQSLE